jgi:hypothetical protein
MLTGSYFEVILSTWAVQNSLSGKGNAEREGFEPSRRVSPPTAFPDRLSGAQHRPWRSRTGPDDSSAGSGRVPHNGCVAAITRASLLDSMGVDDRIGCSTSCHPALAGQRCAGPQRGRHREPRTSAAVDVLDRYGAALSRRAPVDDCPIGEGALLESQAAATHSTEEIRMSIIDTVRASMDA